MKTTVHLKYDKGDVVSLNYTWRNIPEDENRFVVDGYFISLKEDAEPVVAYIFHAYLNKYVGYHEFIPENYLSPLEENHPHDVEIDVKDVFGNDVNIGDQVYYGLYNKYKDEISVTSSITFISGGIVKKITYNNNITGGFVPNGICVEFSRNILHTKPDGGEWVDARRFGNRRNERICTICKTVPETFYKELIDNIGSSWERQALFNDKYVSYEFKELMEIFGQYEQAKEYLENVLEKKESAKKKRQAKKSGGKSKKSGKLENITKDIDKLSSKERQKLIEMLTKGN